MDKDLSLNAEERAAWFVLLRAERPDLADLLGELFSEHDALGEAHSPRTRRTERVGQSGLRQSPELANAIPLANAEQAPGVFYADRQLLASLEAGSIHLTGRVGKTP